MDAPQVIGFAEWLMRVENQLGRLVDGDEAARLYAAGVAVMDAVVRLK